MLPDKIKDYCNKFLDLLFPGVWLAVLYFTLILVVVSALGSYSFNKRLSDKNFDGEPLTTILIDELSKEYNAIKIDIENLDKKVVEQRNKQNKKNKELSDVNNNIQLKTNKKEDIKADLNNEITTISTTIEKIEEEITTLEGKQDRFDSIRSILHDYNFWWFYKWLNGMPDTMRTLLLTMSMGALGSLIFITLEYFKSGKQKNNSWYFYRPFLGMVTALAVFVFAKAGQLTISDHGISENLNPYFISFLGIISGLVSEQATDKLRLTGETFFQSDIEKKKSLERWPIGVKDEMDKQSKSIAELAPFVNATEETINDWINEKEPVPIDEQNIIAAWLSISRRHLFTDIPPDNKTLSQ